MIHITKEYNMLLQTQSMPVTFTRFFSEKTSLTKKFIISDHGAISKIAAAQMTEGTATRVTVDFSDYPNMLLQANNMTAFGYGTYATPLGDSAKIVVAKKANPVLNIIARTHHSPLKNLK